MTAKSLDNLLNPNDGGNLGKLVRRARDLDRLTQALVDALPDDLAGAIAAANVRGDAELVVLAASPAWAARLRFEHERLMAAARSAGVEIQSCKVKVSRG